MQSIKQKQQQGAAPMQSDICKVILRHFKGLIKNLLVSTTQDNSHLGPFHTLTYRLPALTWLQPNSSGQEV